MHPNEYPNESRPGIEASNASKWGSILLFYSLSEFILNPGEYGGGLRAIILLSLWVLGWFWASNESPPMVLGFQ